MFDIICVTSRHLCRQDFLTQIDNIAKSKPSLIILREKDLARSEYMSLACSVSEICHHYNVELAAHTFWDAAFELGIRNIHLPLNILKDLGKSALKHFDRIGASCHSLDDAQRAVKLGATYITVGHIFATDCKRGLPPRGTSLLQSVCENVKCKVYAIGGISCGNIGLVRQCGADGACIMSGFMQTENADKLMDELNGKLYIN